MSCFGSTVCHFWCIAQSPLARRDYLARNRHVDESSRFVIDARSTFARPGQEAGTAPRPGRRVTIPSGAFPSNPRSLTGTCALPQTASWPWTFYLAFPRATIWSFGLGGRKLPCQKSIPPFFRLGGKQNSGENKTMWLTVSTCFQRAGLDDMHSNLGGQSFWDF